MPPAGPPPPTSIPAVLPSVISARRSPGAATAPAPSRSWPASRRKCAPADRLVTRSLVRARSGSCLRVTARGHSARPYFPVAALNLATRSAGIRPRSLTSMPWALAHSRTSVVSGRAPGPCGHRGPSSQYFPERGGRNRYTTPGPPAVAGRVQCSGRSRTRRHPAQTDSIVSLAAIWRGGFSRQRRRAAAEAGHMRLLQGIEPDYHRSEGHEHLSMSRYSSCQREPQVRKILLTWSPVTESNRRPSPYHGQPDHLRACT
jgi:hypothetical protein